MLGNYIPVFLNGTSSDPMWSKIVPSCFPRLMP